MVRKMKQSNKQNWQKKLEAQLDGFEGRPSLLLHSCCAPCSSYVLEYLRERCRITLFYYNPNIEPEAEYLKRYAEQTRLAEALGGFEVIAGAYDNRAFRALVEGYEDEPEGGARCRRCFQMRLEETARLAAVKGFDFFTTTLSISPHKDADVVNMTAQCAAELHGVRVLYADFKKKNGYKRSLELSGEYGLYRQGYCGCGFSQD